MSDEIAGNFVEVREKSGYLWALWSAEQLADFVEEMDYIAPPGTMSKVHIHIDKTWSSCYEQAMKRFKGVQISGHVQVSS